MWNVIGFNSKTNRFNQKYDQFESKSGFNPNRQYNFVEGFRIGQNSDNIIFGNKFESLTIQFVGPYRLSSQALP